VVRAALQGLWSSIASTEEAAAAYSRASQRWLARAGQGGQIAGRVNQHLRAASLSLASDRGLPGEEWSRQLLFASDPDNGYATLPLPAVRLALRAGDLEAVGGRIEELARHLATAASHLVAARAVLEEQGDS
jgi:N-acetylated-alpha-linked acidic dipeptidase